MRTHALAHAHTSRCCTNSAVMVPQTVMTPVFMPPPPPVYFAPPVYTPIYGTQACRPQATGHMGGSSHMGVAQGMAFSA